MDYDNTDIPSAYDKGRDHGPEVLNLWMNAIAPHVDCDAIQTILDLGCGTGRFSEALAARFKCEVVGVDPSKKMLERALIKRLDSRVRYEIGSGEAIPVPDNSVDLIFMSMIFHHFTDPALAARECRRVLRKGGRAFLRAGVREQISRYPYVDFFPESRPILDTVLPSRTLIRSVFEAAGFRLLSTESITQTIADDYAIYADKIASGADSVLARLTPIEFETGLNSLRAYADRVPNQAVVEPIDFFVFH